jgi:hypothetical protein
MHTSRGIWIPNGILMELQSKIKVSFEIRTRWTFADRNGRGTIPLRNGRGTIPLTRCNLDMRLFPKGNHLHKIQTHWNLPLIYPSRFPLFTLASTMYKWLLKAITINTVFKDQIKKNHLRVKLGEKSVNSWRRYLIRENDSL